AALAFKEVLEERRVALVATRFRGRAAIWWMNLCSLRHRQEKLSLSSWIKFREYVEREFVPFNYDSLVYQKLQNLRQGTRSVNEYTMEFHRLLTRVDLREMKNQLVSRYVRGLRAGIRDMLNMFLPDSVSDAHQRVVLVEVQLAQKAGSSFASSSRPGVPLGSGPQSSTVGQKNAGKKSVEVGSSATSVAVPEGAQSQGGITPTDVPSVVNAAAINQAKPEPDVTGTELAMTELLHTEVPRREPEKPSSPPKSVESNQPEKRKKRKLVKMSDVGASSGVEKRSKKKHDSGRRAAEKGSDESSLFEKSFLTIDEVRAANVKVPEG
ncbi:F-box associated ubiquitination effector family protein, partial [Striga hermonthica]